MMTITATDRLARARHQEYDWQQQEKGDRTWMTASVRTLNAWLSELWEEGMYAASNSTLLRPLRPAEEQIIWENILSSDTRNLPLDVSATAELARTSWKLLCDWHLPLEGPEWAVSEDARAFQKWAAEFRGRCKKKGWFSASELSRHVIRLIREGQVDVPDQVELVGFLEQTPAEKRFFETLQMHGTSIQETPSPNHQGQVFRLPVIDTLQEMRIAAAWARQIMETDPGAEHKSFRIGVVVSGMVNLRSQIERIFSEIFHPQSRLQPDNDSKRLFNISQGLPAGDYPIIQSALQILSIDPREIPVEEASRLLLSPFLPAFHEERSSRALLDVDLRGRGEQYVTLKDLIYLSTKKKDCPVLVSILVAWQAQYSDLQGRKLPSEWAESFSRLLQSGKSNIPLANGDMPDHAVSIGWPGYWKQTSTEYQTYTVWEELMSALVELDGVCGRITSGKAVTILRRMASAKVFQPEYEPAPVQILSVGEAVGISFDHLWVMGMHDDAWPPPCAPAPFVPILLQRRKGLWRSTPEGMLLHARELADRLLKSAPLVIVSHPQREGDADRRISPMFAGLPEVSEEDLGIEPSQTLGEQVQSSSKLEIIRDDEGLPCGEGETRGGTYLFKLQAACPFRAFAELRLGAVPLATAQSGLHAMDRGRMMHHILDILWQQLGTQAALEAMSEQEEDQFVRTIVQEQLVSRVPFRRVLQSERFFGIERDRLVRITREWLALERNRRPFTVLEQEERQHVIAGGLEIRIQEDRVDQLENGERFILDYKTGNCSPSHWDGERPDDPQLPIYAAVADSPVAGISFGSLRKGGMRMKGIANQDVGNSGVKNPRKPLPELIQDWRGILNKLGHDYKAGHALVDPKNPIKTCMYCRLTSLCRVGSDPAAPQHSDE